MNKQMKKIAMISQPMNGLTDEQIKATKADAVAFLEASGYEVVNTYLEDFEEEKMRKRGVNMPLVYIALSIANLTEVDALCCVKGWHEEQCCKFEHDIAIAYGIEVITDADDEYAHATPPQFSAR